MSRLLLAVALALAFPIAQQHASLCRQAEAVQKTTHAANGQPRHDWHRIGGATARALLVQEAPEQRLPWAHSPELPFARLRAHAVPLAQRSPGSPGAGAPRTPLRI